MKIKETFCKFCTQLDEDELKGICESTNNILYDFNDNEFLLWPRTVRNTDNTIIVVNSEDGGSGIQISASEMQADLLREADSSCEVIRYDEQYAAKA